MKCPLLAPLLLLAFIACRSAAGSAGGAARAGEAVGARPEWVLVVHGGAGKRTDPAAEPRYRAGLEEALRRGSAVLAGGGSSLDAVEVVVSYLEDEPAFNAGKGSVLTHVGTHELDAAIMDGRDRSAGAVAGVRTVRHPVHLARLVMEKTPHVLLAGEGAEAFAAEMAVERVENSWFDTPHRRRQLEEALEEERGERPAGSASSGPMGTVGAVALDRAGHLAAATSTGGTTNKLPGRIGDSPLVGAGTWADDATCAVSGTGKGEQFIRNAVASRVSMLMAYGGRSLPQAAEEVVGRVLKPGDGGVIAVGGDGSVAVSFNSEMMGRGVADARGRFEVAVGGP
jgi:isoaspartyl peptidase/L-asparaginase-like protein (Ntn-hydrolase superfamily)